MPHFGRVQSLALTLVLLASVSSHAATLVLLPFDNFSASNGARGEIAKRMETALTSRGWTVVSGDAIEPLLEKERVRYLDSLSNDIRARILAQTNASAIVSGSIYTWVDARESIVALSARMTNADGTLAWGDVAGLASRDTERILGFGRKSTAAAIADDAVVQLLEHFPRASENAKRVNGPRKPMFRSGPASFRDSEVKTTTNLVCVLPFDNNSKIPEAGRVVLDVLGVRLAAESGFDVVEPALVRQAALEAGIASFRGISTDDLAKLAEKVGTSLFLRGTIYDYIDSGSPQLQIEFSLLDVRTQRVLWASHHARKGSDYVGFLMLGAVSNAVSLTDHVIAEMLTKGSK
ncbi:MAG TPA: GNA1162 family protein [Thermoanaerobaculia bacterium]|nr:GNA1162 family protein [Thermoanaerobaculia bacterium]